MYRSEIGPSIELAPGRLQMHNDDLIAGCNDGSVVLKKVQLEGKKRMCGKDFMNGYNGQGMLH
jgi:methionyl-tRNA formyltransferase